MGRAAKFSLAALSGVLLNLPFLAPVFIPLLFVALTPWLVSLESMGRRGAFRSGYVLGFAFFLGQFWFIEALAWRWTGSFGLGLIPYLVACFLASWYFAFAGWLLRIVLDSRRVWLFPLVWAGVEVFRSYIPVFAFPFGLLGTPLASTPAIAASGWLGTVFLTSAWVFAANVLIARYRVTRRIEWSILNAVLLVLFLNFVAYQRPIPGRTIRVASSQTGINEGISGSDTRLERLQCAQDQLVEARRQKADLVVFPEGMGDDVNLPEFKSGAVLYGAQREEGERRFQSAFVRAGGQETYADKTRLVIFGEFVPGRGVIPFLDKFKLGSRDLQPGDRMTTLETPIARIGPIICFEDLFPDLGLRQRAQGAGMLATISIDDWFVGTPAMNQLRDATLFRSIETGLPMVRSASLGISLIADGKGRVLAQAPVGERSLLIAPIDVQGQETPFWQPIFPILSLLASLFVMVSGFFKRPRL